MRGAVEQVRGRVDQLTTEHGRTAESVQQLNADVTKINDEVGDVLKSDLYYQAVNQLSINQNI